MNALAYIGWKVIPRLKIGPLSISPHGIGIAVGYALGGSLLARRAERIYGIKREHIWNMLMYAVVGVVVGARLFYVVGHFTELLDAGGVLELFRIWNGGIVLYGGIFGGIAAAYPYARKHKIRYSHVLDAAAPGFPLGLIFGRIGDLVIGDHLGGRTRFFLGWQYKGGELPDLRHRLNIGDVVHQTALYDLIIVLVLLPIVMRLARKRRPNGWLIMFTATLYAIGRFITDFARSDANTAKFFGLRGTQWVSIVLIIAGVVFLATRWRKPASEHHAAAPLSWETEDEGAGQMIDEGGPVEQAHGVTNRETEP